jgi:hypothetical protein
MEMTETIKKGYSGYLLQGFSESFLKPKEVKELYKKLLKIPSKITTFIKRETIKEAYKHTQWTYFIVDMDNKVFILDY